MRQVTLLLGLIGASVLSAGCPDRNWCAETPLCEDGRAVNCVDRCSQGPCSTGPTFRDCEDGQKCELLLGDPQSTRFFTARAACSTSAERCDPATSPPPQCDGRGGITGCSGYGRVISASCSQAAVFFPDPGCCVTGVNPDAGAAADGGLAPDAGTDGGS